MMLKFASAGVFAASLALVGPAGAQMGASKDPATVQAGSYVVESGHTQVLFDVDHLGVTKYYGEFSGVTGSLTLDPKALDASSVSVTIPVASLSTTSTVLDGELRNPKWLDATTYPTITFVSKKVIPTSATTAKIIGDLTLHGVTAPVTLEASFHGGGTNMMSHRYNVGFDAVGHFKRSDFGVAAYVPMVGDEVEVRIAAAFQKTN